MFFCLFKTGQLFFIAFYSAKSLQRKLLISQKRHTHISYYENIDTSYVITFLSIPVIPKVRDYSIS